MFELEPQAWTIHVMVLGFINVAAIALAVLAVRRQQEQWRELSRFREQCRRIEDHLMSLRRTLATQKREPREGEVPTPEGNEAVA